MERLAIEPMTVGRCRHVERVVRRGGRWRVVDFPALAVLIRHPTRGAVLFDTGYAERFRCATAPFPERLHRWLTPVTLPAAERLAAQLAARDLALGDVRWCVLSHLHADHVAGLRDLPAARFLCTRAERDWARRASRLRGLSQGLLPSLLPPDFDARLELVDDAPSVAPGGPWRRFERARDLFGDNSVLALPLPGHTPGQIGLVLRDRSDRELLLCADACWTHHAWRTDDRPSLLTAPLTYDTRAYRATLDALSALGREHPEIVILPSHCTESLRRYVDGTPAPC